MCSGCPASSKLVIELVSFVNMLRTWQLTTLAHRCNQLVATVRLDTFLTRLTGCSSLCWPDLSSANAALCQAATSSTYISKFYSWVHSTFCALSLRGHFMAVIYYIWTMTPAPCPLAFDTGHTSSILALAYGGDYRGLPNPNPRPQPPLYVVWWWEGGAARLCKMSDGYFLKFM